MRPLLLAVGAIATLILAIPPGLAAAPNPTAPAFGETLDHFVRAIARRLEPATPVANAAAARRGVIQDVLKPSRAYSRPWGVRDGSRWTLDLRRLSDAQGFIDVLGGDRDIAAPGEARTRVELREVQRGVFRWDITEDVALGEISTATLTAGIAGLAQTLRERACEGRAVVFQHAERASLGVIHIETRCNEGRGAGAQATVRLGPLPKRTLPPEVHRFLADKLSSLRSQFSLSDGAGGSLFDMDVSEGRLSARWSLGPDPSPPVSVRGSLLSRKGPFWVGASDATATVSVQETTSSVGVDVRPAGTPSWKIPFFVKPVVAKTLTRIASAPTQVTIRIEDSRNGAVLSRRYAFDVAPSWVLALVGGGPLSARQQMPGPVAGYLRSVLVALGDDLRSIR